MGEMKLKVWGVRSSIPAPLTGADYRARLREAVRQARTVWKENPGTKPVEVFSGLPESVKTLVGGETSCLEIRDGENQLVVDMGTGARRLGYDMMNRGAKGDVHILLTDTRWENIQGWPFFIPGFLPNNRVFFYTIHDNCRERFIRQQHFDHFPVEFENMLSKREFVHCPPGQTRGIVNFQVEPIALDRGGAAFRIQKEDRSLIVCPPLFREEVAVDQLGDRYAEAFTGTDLLVLAYQSFEFGDSDRAMRDAARLAARWKVGRMLLIHHHPAQTDGGLRELLSAARSNLNGSGSELSLAVEGDEYSV